MLFFLTIDKVYVVVVTVIIMMDVVAVVVRVGL